MNRQDIDALYQAFMPLQIAKVVDFAAPIEGVSQVITGLREQGIKIGSCSGYPRAVMEVLVPAAALRGYAPDHWVATDDLSVGGRPGPWMALQNVIALGIDAVAHCVKVDDAVPGISEGLNAGMWSIGLALSGNEFGATWQEYQQMSTAEIERRRALATEKLYAAGAHYVIDTLVQLPGVIDEINQRLASGERP
jgi:phosphonoacetaldehyde hydrolase